MQIRLPARVERTFLEQALLENVKSLLPFLDLGILYHRLLGSHLLRVYKHLRTFPIEHHLVLVPVLAHHLVELVDGQLGDLLLRDACERPAHTLVEVNRGRRLNRHWLRVPCNRGLLLVLGVAPRLVLEEAAVQPRDHARVDQGRAYLRRVEVQSSQVLRELVEDAASSATARSCPATCLHGLMMLCIVHSQRNALTLVGCGCGILSWLPLRCVQLLVARLLHIVQSSVLPEDWRLRGRLDALFGQQGRGLLGPAVFSSSAVLRGVRRVFRSLVGDCGLLRDGFGFGLAVVWPGFALSCDLNVIRLRLVLRSLPALGRYLGLTIPACGALVASSEHGPLDGRLLADCSWVFGLAGVPLRGKVGRHSWPICGRRLTWRRAARLSLFGELGKL